jgi:hypothetical protein
MKLVSQIQGIPCLIDVTRCHVVKGSFNYNAPSDLDYYGYHEIEFEVLDRKGYKASWLERKMTEDDIEKIEAQILEQYNRDE